MSNVKILIVEDESLVAMDMADMLTRLGYEVLSPAYSYQEATTRLEEEKPDFVLADINLGGGKTGIDLAHLVRSKYKLPLVFLTSYTDKETVAKAAATQPGGYLIKPFSQDELFASIEVALATFSGKKMEASEGFNIVNESLFVKTDAHFVKVNVADIQWLESDHNYLYIVTDKGKHIVRSSFREILSSLPAVPFMQIHKSFVVNLHKIDSFSHTEVVISKTAIPLSRNYKEELFEKLKRIQ